jgi:hypothetical protein
MGATPATAPAPQEPLYDVQLTPEQEEILKAQIRAQLNQQFPTLAGLQGAAAGLGQFFKR